MNARKLFAGIVVFMTLPLLWSCASTTALTAVWKDPAYQGPAKKVVVVGLAKQESIRNLFEDEFVKQLAARKIDAVASHTLVPFAQMGDRNLALSKIKGVRADTVLATRLVDRKSVETYVPGTPYPGYYDSWGGYYGFVYSPGYVRQDDYVYLETNLYQSATEKLVWSARSETWLVDSSQGPIVPFIKQMVEKLGTDKIIPAGG